ncbi:hypothetical protein RB195_014782 [Necator americanus]|uniref:Uncharacterized protein n=1 Tax=Necator americanus TaxID=51031 RepID=A0ABR1E1M2_NECAM
MNRHLLTATAVLFVYSCRDDVIQYVHHIEDKFLPLNPLDLALFEDLQEVEHGFLLKESDPAYSNCSKWKAHANGSIGEGWSKSVYSLSGSTVIKCPNLEGQTFQNCFHANFGEEDWESRCRLELLRRFLSEIKMLLRLQNSPYVIKLVSYCIPRDPVRNLEHVNIVTEKGTPLDILSLLQLSLLQRNHLFNSLLSFFIENPTLRLQDFRRQQLVMVGDQVKIVDFDEAYFTEDFTTDQYHSLIRRKLFSELLVNHANPVVYREYKILHKSFEVQPFRTLRHTQQEFTAHNDG